MILEVFPSGPLDTNLILLGCPDTKKAALIDAPQDSLSVLLPRIEKLGLTIEMLLLTHTHWDHTAEAALFKKTFNVPIFVHSFDAPNLEKPGSDQLPLFFAIKAVKPDGFLTEGQTLWVGNLELKVIHTPGHTPGGVCFYLEKEQLLISGDTLFRGSMGRIDFPQSNADQMWESLKKLAKLPEDTVVIPGHGEKTSIQKEAFWMADAKRRFGDD